VMSSTFLHLSIYCNFLLVILSLTLSWPAGHIQNVRKRLYLFQNFFFGPLLFGGRHLENFVPTGTAGISIKSRSI
jgi:hypothetical protein